jgi:MoaA/NifB/PqqE/SkfB family radical SAM enzyme
MDMALTGLHLLLTYSCNYECDHCFVWSGPSAPDAVLTRARLDELFRQAADVGTIRDFYFEGGEPFLYYPLMFYGVARAGELGFRTGIVSNAYWATSEDDARLWLEPLAQAGLDELGLSTDAYHGDAVQAERAAVAARVAAELGVADVSLTIEPPSPEAPGIERQPGEPVVGGDVMFRGRAATTLTAGLPIRPWESFDRCPHELLTDPGRVHVDPFGFVHLCQGLCMGNLFDVPLAVLLAEYDAEADPIVGAIVTGGPAELVRRFGLRCDDGYVDACHLCYIARAALRSAHDATLAPPNVYGE